MPVDIGRRAAQLNTVKTPKRHPVKRSRITPLALRDRIRKEQNMKLIIWTKDRDTEDLVPYAYDHVEEIYIERTEDVRIQSTGGKIEVTAKA